MIFKIEEKYKHECGIYCIRNIINDNVYIGQTTEGFYERWIRHSNMLKNGKHFNAHLQRAYDKYGSDNFEMTILEICNDISNISILEAKYISEYKKRHNCYNDLSGGPTMCGENNPFYGKKHTKESLEKMSLARTGKYTGKQNNFYGADHSGDKNGFYGKHHTEKARKKMSESKSKMYKGENNPFYGKHHTPETREKLKDNGKYFCKKVMCIETHTIYTSIKEAAEKTNTCARSISAVCCGSRKKANNLHWTHV